MPDIRIVISDPKAGKAYQTELTGAQANILFGKSIGDELDGALIGVSGYKLVIRGGTDKDGFPMRSDLPGSIKKKVLTSGGTGFVPTADGLRKRKTFRGREISLDTGQVNMKVTAYGAKPLVELIKPSEKKEKKKKEKKKEAKPKEAPKAEAKAPAAKAEAKKEAPKAEAKPVGKEEKK
jgi:small subunit ribosomal protein S6e